jgi:hypothetical protein
MKELRVYWKNYSELAEYEAINKGYCLDLYIQKENNLFNLSIYDIVRLKQDFECETEEYGYYSIDYNLVLVTEVKKENILKTIISLDNQNYFDNIKTLKYEHSINEYISKNNLTEILLKN